jgi:hypothetical protein
MEAPARERSRQLVYQLHDSISIPEDVPDLEVKRGEEGIVRELVMHNESVTAFVEIRYSTGQTKGWVVVEVMPEEKVLSVLEWFGT